MRFLVIYDIKEGRWHKEYAMEYETYNDMLEATKELPYGWSIKKVYEIAKEIEL